MATVTITTTAPQDARLGPAFGDLLQVRNASGQQRDATSAEVKAWLITQLQQVVAAYEDRVTKAAIAAPSAFSPT
jgi:hypothetical protein